jgi:GntR family transcriptional regulator
LCIRSEREPQTYSAAGNHQNREATDKAAALASLRLSDDQLFWLAWHRPGEWLRLRRRHYGDTLPVTMVLVKVLRDEPVPLHEQVAAEIRRDIAEGQVRPGERLPPARDMAAVLGVHPNTVFRALRVLREEGILEFRRGRGVTVAGTPERSAVVTKARELIDLARQQGYRREDLVAIIEGLPRRQHPAQCRTTAARENPFGAAAALRR